MDEIKQGVCFERGCPTVLHGLGAIEELADIVRGTTEQAASDKVLEAAEALSRMLYEEVPNGEGLRMLQADGTEIEVSPEVIAADMRKTGAAVANHFDEQREAGERQLKTLTEACRGPLVLRARKGGRTVLVRLCNSPSIPNDDAGEFSCEAVHITRR